MHAVWSACESCMRACLATRMLATCLPVIPSELSEHKERDVVLILHHCHVGVMNARYCANEGTHSYSCIQRCKLFARGLQGGPEATRLRSRFAVAHHAECVPCRAEERREASRALRRFFLGKAKRFVCESCTICRCNASVRYSDFRSIDGREPMPG